MDIENIDEQPPVPYNLVQKYNRFVDGIYGRINKILKKSYDPVSVRLTTPESKSTVKKLKKTKKRTEKLVEIPVGIPEKFVTSSKPIKKNNNKSKQATNKKSRAKGTLFGLSSLKRVGNVTVNAMADYTTVKSNFILGPLILKVEKSFGRGLKKELRSATATTTEMIGRISLKVVNGAATLHSVKVQQPKQVKVESSDNHDRTREFVWKRSSHIAHVVSQKLTSAAKSMLQPPPST